MKTILNGSRVLIAGASGSIGQMASRGIADLGGQVILCGRNEVALRQLASSLPTGNHETLEISEVDNELVRKQIVDHAANFGGFDSLLLLTGKLVLKPSHLLSEVDLSEVIHANYSLPVSILNAFLGHPNRVGEDRSVVGLSSVSASKSEPGLSAYGASKAAFESHLKTMAVEVARRGIRINIIRAGMVNSSMAEIVKSGVGETNFSKHSHSYPLGLGHPEDLLNPILFALSPESKWVTGSVISVDGGYSA